MKQTQFTAPALPSFFFLLSGKVVYPLQINVPAGMRLKVIELDNDGNASSCSAAAAEMGPCPEKHRSVVYRAEAQRPSFADIFPAKKRTPSSLSVTAGRQSRLMMRSGENK